jgi:hypothetical protein
MDTKTGNDEEAPPPNDLEGWRAAIASGDLARYRIERIVEAAQTLGVRSDRQVIDAIMGHVSDEMLRWLRGFIGRNHRNEGIDIIIEGVHGKMIEAVLRPKSADARRQIGLNAVELVGCTDDPGLVNDGSSDLQGFQVNRSHNENDISEFFICAKR